MSRAPACLALAATLAVAAPAAAAVPSVLNVQGSVVAAGGPAPDGDYYLTFAIYPAKEGGTAAWKDPPVIAPLKGGVFSLQLGAATPITPALLAGLPEAWIGVSVGSDPELPRKPLGAVLFAIRAAAAEALECSGCVGAAQLDPKALAAYAKLADLAPYAKVLDLQNYAPKGDLAEYVKAASLAKVAGSGDYSDLTNKPKFSDVASTGSYGDLVGAPKLAQVATSGAYADLKGLPILAKVGDSCGTNLVMRGIKADGSYDCVAGGLTVDQLPKDGLDEISNGQLTNQFTDTWASAKAPIDIPDNSGPGVIDTIAVPDIGTAQAVSVAIDIANSDISKLRVTLFDPAGGQYKLHDQGGSGAVLKATYPAPDKPASGDLSVWSGKKPAGIWSINVADLAGTPGGKDGKINSWSITIQTLSSKKTASNGLLVLNGGLRLSTADAHPVPCSAAQIGYTYLNSKEKALYVCNGDEWFPLSVAAGAGTPASPALHCKELHAKKPALPSGVYWIDPDGGSIANAVQTYCDMQASGGGWTLVARMTNGCMTDGNGAVGVVTAPGQAGCAKLSDATINAVRAAAGSDGVFWGYHDNANYKLPPSGRYLKIVSGSFDANKHQPGLQQQCSCQPGGPWSPPFSANSTMSGVYNHSGGAWECVTAGQSGCDGSTVFSSGLFLYQHALNQPGTFPSNYHGVAGGANGWLFVR